MSTRLVQDHNLEKQREKQIGCMASFLQIFDRQQLLNGKRIYSTARFSPSVDSSSDSEPSASPAVSMELAKPHKITSTPSPNRLTKRSPVPEVDTPAKNPAKPSLPLPIFEFKEGTRSSWKFSREAPRLSLDSRSTVNAKGSLCQTEIRTNSTILSSNRFDSCAGVEEIEKQRRSTSVIAKLMGLEPPAPSDLQPEKKSELRRSASESRVSKDFSNNFRTNQNQSSFGTSYHRFSGEELVTRGDFTGIARPETAKSQSKSLGTRKSFFDSQENFPEPKQSVAIHGEIERKLKMRGVDEASKDLETLKQILEALQLKGLLRSHNPSDQRNFVFDRRFDGYDSPIVLMKPERSAAPSSRASRNFYYSPPSSFGSRTGPSRNVNRSPDTDQQEIGRNVRNQAGTRSPVRANRTVGGDIETHRRRNDLSDHWRFSSVQSPKSSPNRTVSDHQAVTKSPRYRKQVSADQNLLERCDKLLLSIAEFTSTESQPSPVSVLDSSFHDETTSSPPSPVAKRSIDFKEQRIEFGDEVWSPEISLTFTEEDSEDSDLVYIAEIFRALSYTPFDSDLFFELEKQQFLNGKDTSKASILQRKLIFDTITEILDQNRHSLPWKNISCANSGNRKPNFHQTWSEFQRLRERDECEDLFDVICGVLRKDLAGDTFVGFGGCEIEMSETVLDIERLLFKDLIGETIKELSAFGRKCSNVLALRRKLVF